MSHLAGLSDSFSYESRLKQHQRQRSGSTHSGKSSSRNASLSPSQQQHPPKKTGTDGLFPDEPVTPTTTDPGEGKEQEQPSSPTNPFILPTTGFQFIFMFFIVCSIVFGGGLWISVQSYYGPLELRGFCSAHCTANDTLLTSTCAAQKKCLSQPVNLGMSLLNLLGVVFGALGDYFGGLTGFVLGNVVVILGPLLMAWDVENGTGYSIAVPLCAAGCALSFFAVLSQLIPKYIPPARIGLCCSAFTSMWDLAMSIAPLIGVMLEETSLSVLSVFAVVGSVTVPSLFGVFGVLHHFHKDKNENETRLLSSDNNNNAEGYGSTTIQQEESVQQINTKQNDDEPQQEKEPFFHVAKRVIGNRRFVGLTCGATSTVTVGYLLMTVLGLLVSTHGADEQEAHEFERYASIIMGILGALVGLVTGRMLDAAENWRSHCRIFAFTQAGMLILIAVLVTIQNDNYPWQIQYLTFVFVTIQRMIGFSTINVSWSKAMIEAGDGAAAGVGLGLIYSIAGGISLILGRVGTSLAHDGHFIVVNLVFCIVGAVLNIIQAIFAV